MKHQSLLGPGKIQFHLWCPPPINPGMYTVHVNQNVTGLGEFDSEPFKFSVAGPRFSLSPTDVYSVYPPKEKAGDFANTLPHVVFSRRTLPWERSIKPHPPAWVAKSAYTMGQQITDGNGYLQQCKTAGTSGALTPKWKEIAGGTTSDGTIEWMCHHPCPWMAVLVFSAADFPPANKLPDIQTRVVKELLTGGDQWVGPKLEIENESLEDLCTTVDIPWELFQATAPSYEDLKFLAHVREVNTGAKETSSLLADGWFSVVLANRFPQPGEKDQGERENRAYLVSLEGLQDYLPDSGKDPAKKPVRLVVLSSWSFRCREAFTFKSSLENLDVARIALPLWEGPAAAERLQDAKELLRAAYQRGYTALNHSTRLGEKAVSWYRGPLVPFHLVNEQDYKFQPVADAALRYDPLQGMMDVTYAGAFQLGRLIALQDRHFATSLYAYRTRVRRHVNGLLSKNRLGKVLPGTADSESESKMMEAYLRGSRTSASSWSAAREDDFDPEETKNEIERNGKGNADLSVPPNVRQWLGRLMLLYRVPFNYLVPDERMLPRDSIRFFYLDPGWLTCLLQGACSVGRASSRDELVDQELRNNFLRYAIEESRTVRTPQTRDAKGAWTQLTGFLLRSPVVEGWQGLEMRAWEKWDHRWDDAKNDGRYDDKKEEAKLKPLRIDRLAPDIMFCIFDGKLNHIEIKQPPEAMHFGATKDQNGPGYRSSSLRVLVGSSPGKQIDPRKTIPVKLRGKFEERVVDVKTLAVELEAALADKGRKPLTSAGFGVEMVESPGKVIFDVDYHRRVPGGST